MELDLHSVLRRYCEISCNPSRLQQRLVSGGRRSGDYTTKMERHKQDCMVGCFCASTVDTRLAQDPKERAQIQTLSDGLNKDMGSVLDYKQVTEKTEKVQEWFIKMRLECAKACAEKQGDKGHKAERACLVGCDKYFDVLMAD
eukprot:m.44707 g.44707  ORF g.44707 m.44707 type:complete len:143 (-) comp13042_c0_seq1:1561-1989(-)